MRKNWFHKELLVIWCFILMFVCFNSLSAAEEPIVEAISYSPESPVPESSITVNATITGDNISTVYLVFKECKPGLCYRIETVTMTPINTSMYQADIVLTHEDTTYVSYQFDIKSNGIYCLIIYFDC